MTPTQIENIKHVVVLVLENRSFDHLFGDFPNVNGNQSPYFYNLANPADPNSKLYGGRAVNVITQPGPTSFDPAFDPGHSFSPMMQDIFGPACTGCLEGAGILPSPPPSYGPSQTMCGFVSANPTPHAVMSYFQYLPVGDPGRLNVLHTLAENFVLCDCWFCDTPSCTIPNRLFLHAATNRGWNDDNSYPGYEPTDPPPTNPVEPDMYAALTIYEQLDIMSFPSGMPPGWAGTPPNWAMYGFPQDEYDSGMFAYTAALPNANRSIFDLPVDVLTGNLPFYTFIMPSLLFGTGAYGGSANGNSMHPNGDIRLGENLLASVYNVLRNSPLWDNTLFIVTFDENGGIYDHVTPPGVASTTGPGVTPPTPPDGINYPPSGNPQFDYTILGPRIPALLISPWVAKGQVDPNQYQNTSILRFVQDLFAAQNNKAPTHLTKRDEHAPRLDLSPYWLSSGRTDCPQSIGLYKGFPNWGTELIDPQGGPEPSSQKIAGGAPYKYAGGDPYTGPDIPNLTATVPVHRHWPEGSGSKPASSALDFAREYCNVYPGHADSGKPLTKGFATHGELIAYMRERRRAARTFYERNRRQDQ
jgi:phospholipase C